MLKMKINKNIFLERMKTCFREIHVDIFQNIFESGK